MSSNGNVKELVEEVGSKKDAGAAEVESGAAVVKIDESVRNQGKENNNDGSSSEALLPTSSAQVLQRRNRKIKIKLKDSSHQQTVRGNHADDDGNKTERVSKANRVRRNSSRRRRPHYCKHHNSRQNGNFVLIRSHALPVVYDLHKVNTKRHSCRAYSSSPAGERKGSLKGSRKFLLFTFTPHPSCSTACHPPPSLNPHTNNTSRCCSCRCCSRRREARRVREGLKMTPQTGQEGEVKSGVRSKLVRPELPISKNGMDGGHGRSPNNDGDDASNLKSKRESAERSPDPRRGSKRKKKHKHHHHHRSCSSSSSTASSSVQSRSPSSHNGDEDEDESGRVLETSRKKSKKLKKTKRHHHHHHHHRRHSHRSREGRERKRNKSKAKKKKKRRRRSRSRAKSKDDKVKNGSCEKTNNEQISCCHHPCDKSEEDEGIKKEAPKETDSSAMNIIAVQPDKCNDAPSEPDKLPRKDQPGAKETQLEMFILGLSNGKGKKSPTRLRPLENGIVLELRDDPDEESVCSSSSVRSNKARSKSHSRSRSKSRSRSYTRSRSRSPHYHCSPGAVSHRSSRSHSLSYRSRSHCSSSSYHHRSFSSRSSSYCSERSRKRSHHGSSTSSSYSSRSRSRSRTSSRSRSLSSRSRSRSSSVRRSRSRSRSKSRSVSRSKSRSRTRSKSRTKSRSKSRTKSRSKSGTKSRSRSKTRSKSRSKTRKRSRSIPRRRGSPSFLDRRRITSARKRPIPYKRKPGSEWENSSESSDSSS